MKKIIALFPCLKELYFKLWPPWHKGDEEIPNDNNLKIAHVKDWKLACPRLTSVTFIDGLTLQIRKGSTEWSSFSFF